MINVMLDRWIYTALMIGLMGIGHNIDVTVLDYSLTLQGFSIEEGYRLVTGHFMHFGSDHFWLNLAGLVLITVIFFNDKARLKHLLAVTMLAMVVIDGLFYYNMSKTATHYLGYSGILFAIAGYSGIRSVNLRPMLGIPFMCSACALILRDLYYYSDSLLAIDAHITGFIVGIIYALFFQPSVDSIPQLEDTASTK